MSNKLKKNGRGFLPVIIFFVVFAAILLILAFLLWPGFRDKGMEYIYPLEYESVIDQYSQEYSIDTYLVMGLICAESSYDPDAVSSAGAIGLMQIMPDTADWLAGRMDISYSEEELYNPVYNIRMGCYYLRLLIDYFGVQDTAIAAYNAGIGNVQTWLEDQQYSLDGEVLVEIPFQETRDYVERVNEYREIYYQLYGPNETE